MFEDSVNYLDSCNDYLDDLSQYEVYLLKLLMDKCRINLYDLCLFLSEKGFFDVD